MSKFSGNLTPANIPLAEEVLQEMASLPGRWRIVTSSSDGSSIRRFDIMEILSGGGNNLLGILFYEESSGSQDIFYAGLGDHVFVKQASSRRFIILRLETGTTITIDNIGEREN